MKKLIILTVSVFLFAFSISAIAGEGPKITWGGLFYMYNFFHSNTDFNKDTDDANSYAYIHADIQATADFGSGVSTYMMVGAWGQHGMSSYYTGGLGENIDPSLRILQGYLTITNLFDTPLSFRIGKERLLYGDGALAFDGGEDGVLGAKLMYNSGPLAVDLFAYRLAQFGGIAAVGAGTDVYPANWNLYGVYATYKAMNDKVKISPYWAMRPEILSEDETDQPMWLGARLEGSFVDGLNTTLEYTMMMGEDEAETEYKGTHLCAALDYKTSAMPLLVGGAYIMNSGDDTETEEYELYESATNGPYTFGFYKDWPGYGPAHLMTTGYGFSGFASHNSYVCNLNLINGHASYKFGNLCLRFDYFMYNRNWVPDGVEEALGNEMAFMLKYDYKATITFGATFGIWSPGDHINEEFEAFGLDTESATGGYIWFAKSF